MNKHYNVIKEEFDIKKYISYNKLNNYIKKEITIEELNFHEKNILKNKKSYFLLPYSTKNIYDLISYYIIEFDKKDILDIIDIRIIEDLHFVGKNKYVKTGFKFINAITMKDEKEKNKKINNEIDIIINNYLKKYEGADDIGNFSHPDNIIDLVKEQEKYFFEKFN